MFRSIDLEEFYPIVVFTVKNRLEKIDRSVAVALGITENSRHKTLPVSGRVIQMGDSSMSETTVGWRAVVAGALLPGVAVLALSCEPSGSGAMPDLDTKVDLAEDFTTPTEQLQLGSVSPSSGGTAGGTMLTLTGSGFRSGAVVRVGGTIASSIQVVLTGVDLTSWGADLPGEPRLGDLVMRILRLVPDLPRLRISSIDSIEADENLMQAIAS